MSGAEKECVTSLLGTLRQSGQRMDSLDGGWALFALFFLTGAL